MKHILIVEDEEIIRSALKRLLEKNSYQVSETDNVQSAKRILDKNTIDLIISDLRLPGAVGTDLIQHDNDIPVLIMTSYASMRSAIDSMKMGAVDYIAKPFDYDDLLLTVANILEQHHKNHGDVKESQAIAKQYNIIGNSPVLRTIFKHIQKIAPTDCNVLIQGETGTGKELIAKAIHQASNRHNKALISVNCAAIPETLIESELFGYEKGAFTGANASRIGLIEAAHQGTLFLDEIGELPLEAQARLLRFLQEAEIRRIGSVETQTVDVRIVSATHRDLKKLSEQGLFRQDLYYRLNVMPIKLPPLRERGKDILLIAETFLQRACKKMNINSLSFTPEAIQALNTYPWPGNIRELENVIERAVILSEQDTIDYADLAIEWQLINTNNSNRTFAEQDEDFVERKASTTELSEPNEEGMSLEDYFQHFILEHQDQMSETELARKLGVSRKCLWERRQRLGIPRKKAKDR